MRRAFTLQLYDRPERRGSTTREIPDDDWACTCFLGRPPCGFCTRPWECECDGNYSDGHDPACPEDE